MGYVVDLGFLNQTTAFHLSGKTLWASRWLRQVYAHGCLKGQQLSQAGYREQN